MDDPVQIFNGDKEKREREREEQRQKAEAELLEGSADMREFIERRKLLYDRIAEPDRPL